MLFDFDLIVPAATPADSPISQIAKLTRGKLQEIRVFFPPGPATLVHVVVRHNLHQLVPANPEGDINFDDIFILSRLRYELVDPPYELTMIGWSPNTVYDHTITFQFDLEPASGDTWEEFNRQLFEMQPINRRD